MSHQLETIIRYKCKHPELLEGKPTEENAYPAEECV